MSSAIQYKHDCASCDEMVGVFSCRGCLENFCVHHTKKHRDGLDRQLNDIVLRYNDLSENVHQTTVEEGNQRSIRTVNEWERESIEKIRRLADETRQQLSTNVYERADKFKDKLAELKRQLDQARRDGGFYEKDIENWNAILKGLRRVVDGQEVVRVDDDRGSFSFVSRIVFNDGLSDEPRRPRIKFIDYHHPEDQGEYNSGNNTVRFQLADYKTSTPALFGIVSKKRTTTSQDPNKNPTFYGWTDKHRVYRGGKLDRDDHGYRTDFQDTDVLELGLNCRQQTITLKNERTNRSSAIPVPLDKCPFPWQLNVRLLDRPE